MILTTECAPKLLLLIAKKIRKFQMILDIENSLEIHILALFDNYLQITYILGKKSCFLGPTIENFL